MFEETLIPGAKASLAILGRSGLLTNAYMAGGTAAALQLGHRISVDFDFFTEQAFIPRSFADELSKQGAFEENQVSQGTVLGNFECVKFSLFMGTRFFLILFHLNPYRLRISVMSRR